ASCAPLHAVDTMARSSRRRGAKIPGVSMNTSCAWPTMAIPRSSARVVCTLGVTMATLLPTSALSSVDLPALGAPISEIKPQRVGVSILASWPGSGIGAIQPHALAHQHGGRGGLPRSALRRPQTLDLLEVGQDHGHAEFRIVVW